MASQIALVAESQRFRNHPSEPRACRAVDNRQDVKERILLTPAPAVAHAPIAIQRVAKLVRVHY